MTAIQVDVLFAPGCASKDAARDAVERVARAAGVAVEIVLTPVSDQAEARRLRFPGSPTIRVAGRDLEPRAEAADQFGLG
jgi:RNase P/RNase MRP subunit p30